MSKFLAEKHGGLAPYIPGEQPKDTQYIKLNTNESPFSPPPSVAKVLADEGELLRLYSDPENTRLTSMLAETLGVKNDQVLVTNGSDEGLNFAFMAFCDGKRGMAFPDISYGFYAVFAKLYGIPAKKIPLKADFSIDPQDYIGLDENIVIANPNAPTGLALSLTQVESIVKGNPDRVVIIDEAYVDFGGESAVSLVDKYENLLVTQTFSKSRSLAGARLGMVVGQAHLIADLKAMKDSTNPYNVNRLTAAAGCAVLQEKEWFEGNVKEIVSTREWTATELKKLGFTVLPSKANFVFAKSERVAGRVLYEKLKEKGVLVRHFDKDGIREFNRVTIGSRAEMQTFLVKVKEVLEEGK